MCFRALASLVFLACHPAAVPAPDADAAMIGDAPATPQAACGRLAALGCPEGLSSHCTTVLAHVIDAGLESFDLPCMVRAQSQGDLRKCTGMQYGCQP